MRRNRSVIVTRFEIADVRDKVIKHPAPLQLIAEPDAGSYRLYLERDFVTFRRGS